MFHKTLTSYHKDNQWDDTEEHPDGPLWLLTPDELKKMPEGLELEDIFGRKYIVGKHDIDDDTRFGYIAYGIRGYKDD